MSEQSIEKILSGDIDEEVVAAIEPVTPEPEVDPEVEPVKEAPQGQGEDNGEPPAPEPNEQDNPFFHKSQDEKKKRQEKEKELEEMRLENAALKAAQQVNTTPTPEPEEVVIPDPLDDPKGYNKYVADQNNEARISDRINLSYETALDTNDKADVDGAIAKYTEMAKTDPSLVQKARASVRPVNFMMKHVAKVERNSEIDNIDEWKVKKEAEIRASILAENEGKQTAKDDLIASIPETLGNESSAPNLKKGTAVVNKPLEDILPPLK